MWVCGIIYLSGKFVGIPQASHLTLRFLPNFFLYEPVLFIYFYFFCNTITLSPCLPWVIYLTKGINGNMFHTCVTVFLKAMPYVAGVAVSCTSTDNKVKINCLLINLEYIKCSWTRPQPQQINYTFHIV